MSRSRDTYAALESGSADSLPSTPQRNSRPTSQSGQARLQLNTSMISGPILPTAPQSITGFDDVEGRWIPREHRSDNSIQGYPSSPSKSSTSSRSGPSAIAWLRPPPQSPASSESGEQMSQPDALSAPTRAALRSRYLHGMDRSLSSPEASSSTTTTTPTSLSPSPLPSSSSSSSPSSQRSARPTALSLHSLRLDAQSQSGYNKHAYTNVYPNSLHAGQFLFPQSRTLRYRSPSGSKKSKGSDSSDVTIRPSPVHSTNPFISRTPKRSLSQSSSRSASSVAPSIPPLDLRPPFPGPHPSPSYDPPLRPPKFSALQLQTQLSTIEASGSSEEYDATPTEGEYSRASAHADSFVTASESSPHPLRAGTSMIQFGEPQIMEVDREHYDEEAEDDIGLAIPVAYLVGDHPVEYNDAVGALLQSSDSNTALSGNPSSTHRLSTPLSTHGHLAANAYTHSRSYSTSLTYTTGASQSTSESFLDRRWERDAGFSAGSALGSVRFKRPRREWVYTTPAFWAFWLGFVCPVLWLVGGWHFTRYGEMPPMKTVWEFYFVGIFKVRFGMGIGRKEWWDERMGWCLGKRRKRADGGNGKEKEKENARDASENGSTNGIPPGGGVIGNPVGDGDLEKGYGRHPRQPKRQHQQSLPPLPRWIQEKQSTESKIFKRSLRGISFGYPFIPRPPPISSSPPSSSDPGPSAMQKCGQIFMAIITKPNRLFDLFSCRQVEGRPWKGRE
ncbi:hypothetical protein D9758_011126 [Tetrapyrgos nigripes]|uniref:Uncharacterized protein n=1 Tax=Tetrapyrgos nigripes TaxID=182062 RepID=A0A8H5CJV1_9AGAR|nr:hypothetical protein D9758_011126 [Tetrapyrgos nigripes]